MTRDFEGEFWRIVSANWTGDRVQTLSEMAFRVEREPSLERRTWMFR